VTYGLLEVEFLADRGIGPDQLGCLLERLGRRFAEGEQPEPLRGRVRDPVVAVRKLGQPLAQLVERG
jgi:hypothetical protein